MKTIDLCQYVTSQRESSYRYSTARYDSAIVLAGFQNGQRVAKTEDIKQYVGVNEDVHASV